MTDTQAFRFIRVIDIIEELQSFGMQVDVWDPWVDPAEAQHEYGLVPIAQPQQGSYDGIVLAVAHRQFSELGIDGIRRLGQPESIIYDVKYLFDRTLTDGRL